MLLSTLAQKAEMTSQTLSKIETGQQEPYAAQIALLAAALGVRVGELFGDAPPGDAVTEVVAAAMAANPETVRLRLTAALRALSGGGGAE
ncbi:hypothetical protein LBMAG42_57670 [Deltaproteobacteria bacterium]|nr:hypothetical protein LBMAG42_57670 [Deltaproteobacteria bacterium]